jgi:hypothetical protein
MATPLNATSRACTAAGLEGVGFTAGGSPAQAASNAVTARTGRVRDRKGGFLSMDGEAM